jgi:hypothetical protein
VAVETPTAAAASRTDRCLTASRAPGRTRTRGRPNPPATLRPHARQAGPYALPDARPLELGYRREYMQLQPTGRRGRVDPLAQADERNAYGVELVEQQDQVPQVAPEPIQPPDHEHVKPALPGIRDKRV